MNFDRPNLTLVIDRRLYRPQEDSEPLSIVEAAIAGGITMLQLRLTVDGAAADLAADAIAMRLREMSEGRVPFLVTGDLQLAERIRADGVLLVGERSYKPADAKDYVRARNGTLIGCYADSVIVASRAERGGADFVQVGPAFETEEVEPLALIRKVKDAINIPIVAFGGVDTPQKAASAIEAGADGIAVTQAIIEADDPRQATEALWAAISK